MKRTLIVSAVLVTAALWTAPVWAGRASPDALLSHRDLRHQEQAIQNALEYNRTGQAEIWKNASTGHRGRVTPTRTYRNAAGQDCRKYERRLKIDDRRVKYRGTRCRTAAGIWLRPVAPRPVHARGYDDHRRHYPRYRPHVYWPVSVHLLYEFGHHRHKIGGHRHHRHRIGRYHHHRHGIGGRRHHRHHGSHRPHRR